MTEQTLYIESIVAEFDGFREIAESNLHVVCHPSLSVYPCRRRFTSLSDLRPCHRVSSLAPRCLAKVLFLGFHCGEWCSFHICGWPLLCIAITSFNVRWLMCDGKKYIDQVMFDGFFFISWIYIRFKLVYYYFLFIGMLEANDYIRTGALRKTD